jgi:hypothetical protein
MSVPVEYRKSIESLITLYRLEVDVRDLYVEGKSDKYFLEWHLKEMGVTQPDICLIEDIHIPSDDLSKKGYENNNRDRILLLISCLNKSKSLGKYKGIIDRDILHFTGDFPIADNILQTDYSCLEMYAYNDDVMMKINDTGFSHKMKNNSFLVINEMLKITSSIRIFEKREKLPISKLKLDRYVEYKNKLLSFDREKYLTAIFNNNSFNFAYNNFSEKISTISDELSDYDARDYSNGHDFIGILKCVLKKTDVINNNITDDIIRTMIMVAIDTKYLLTCELFKALISFYKE